MTLAELDGMTDSLGEPFQHFMARLTRELFPQRDCRGDDGAGGNTGMLF